MENPGYPQAYHTFCNMGYQVKTVAAGTELSEEELQDVDIIYMMPSHQFPLGTVMPLGQRLELLRWAQEKENRYLIEDDHDSEYRYRGKPIPSMQSIDRTGKVIYLGTFSKSIAPSLRISYMVLPPGLMAQYHRKCGFYSNTVPKIQQEILRAFIQDGYFERHLNKMRGIYKSRHDFLLGELRQCSWVKGISGEHAGLHLLVEVDTCMTEEMLCAKAGEAGVKVSGIGAYMLTDDEETSGENTQRQYPVLVLGYGKAGEQEIQEGLHVLEKILRNSKK